MNVKHQEFKLFSKTRQSIKCIHSKNSCQKPKMGQECAGHWNASEKIPNRDPDLVKLPARTSLWEKHVKWEMYLFLSYHSSENNGERAFDAIWGNYS